ncbi:PREDICTED: protein FAN-like [Nicrophorus vespilloides]|uniref:Protein FAN-like n=1 Tax=Nicrophorus vespilloides TaxID=110193 RepID=A0ABM1MER4_NICVS|nr:PREDICTED: protein FAN-like [Nicrophorus vespilloides]
MDKGRFSLLLLDPREIYFEDFSAVLITTDVTIKTFDFKKVEGRLKLCSKSLVFDPKDNVKPLIKIPFKECYLIEEWKGSNKFINNDNVIRIETKQYIEMLERNIIAPYKFCDNGKFIISLTYANSIYCLRQICQLKRATTLNASEQDDMIATIVHSRHSRISFDPLWLDLYEEVILETHANKITPLVINPGRVVLSTSRLYFQPYNNIETYPIIKIKLCCIQRIFKRRFLLQHTGLEMYYISSDDNKERHIYLKLLNEEERDKLHTHLIQHPELKLNNRDQDVMTLQWQNGVISNYEYLQYINSLGDRSKNDLTQYPVFPWIIFDYKSPTIDLSDVSIYRDLTKPIGALNDDRLRRLMERYEEMSEPKFIYGSHYSTPGFVLFYLVRLYPQYMLCLQNGRFDHPDRMFNSCADLCKNSLNDMSDFKELIPDFYDVEQGGSFLVNNLGINFGYRHNGVKVSDVVLPPWAESPMHFVQTLRDALESDIVSQNLHCWIDLIFGYKQRGEEALKSKNLYYHLCYEGSVDLDSITDFTERHTYEVQIMEFGQIPRQVFKLPHPKRKVGCSLLIEPTQVNSDSVEDKWKCLSSLTLKTTYSTHKDKVSCVFFSEDSERIISVGHDSKLKVFSVGQERQIRSASIGSMPLSCCVKLPYNNILVIGSFGNEIILYDLDFGRVTQTVTAHDDAITCVAWGTKSNLLCSGSGDCTVGVWRSANREGIKKVIYPPHHFDHNSHVTSLCLDRDNKYLAVGTEDGEIYVWNMQDYRLEKKYLAHSKKVTSISFTDDSLKIISCSLDKTFQVSDMNTGMSMYRKILASPLHCLKLDDYLLLIGSESGDLYIWDIVEVKLLLQMHAHQGSILSLDIAADRKYLITSGEDQLIKTWVPL